jgi:hypothetical protein
VRSLRERSGLSPHKDSENLNELKSLLKRVDFFDVSGGLSPVGQASGKLMRGRQGKQIFLAGKKISSPCHTRIARENRSQVQTSAISVLHRWLNSGFVRYG